VDALEAIFDRQLRLQKHSFGVDPTGLDDEQLSEWVRWNVLALEDELHEALAEVRWKPWSIDSGFANRDAYVKELVDAVHFLVNLFLAAGATPDEVLTRYLSKANVNSERQAAGYTHDYMKGADGRALDEPE
jgi:dimeric dUTPase (all-alpha-NTP-PPase superfamily)